MSFFIVHFSPGKGPRKHRHPCEATIILLEGEIEAIVDHQKETLRENSIVVIPAGAWHEFKNCSEKQAALSSFFFDFSCKSIITPSSIVVN